MEILAAKDLSFTYPTCESPALDGVSLSLNKGEFVLLCSDGLHDQVSEPEIYYEIYETGKPEAACDNLVKLANARGGTDNITLVLISF